MRRPIYRRHCTPCGASIHTPSFIEALLFERKHETHTKESK